MEEHLPSARGSEQPWRENLSQEKVINVCLSGLGFLGMNSSSGDKKSPSYTVSHLIFPSVNSFGFWFISPYLKNFIMTFKLDYILHSRLLLKCENMFLWPLFFFPQEFWIKAAPYSGTSIGSHPCREAGEGGKCAVATTACDLRFSKIQGWNYCKNAPQWSLSGDSCGMR